MTISWNYPQKNSFPNPIMQGDMESINTATGLTELGIELVNAMEQKGIIVDVSHLSDKGFYDVLDHTQKPFVASHSNARAVSGCSRNLTDDMIKKLADRGGLTGINFCSSFLDPDFLRHKPRGTIEHMVQHIAHLKNIGGIDCIGLGSDFDGIDGTQELNTANKMPLLAQSLDKAGFTTEEIEKIYSKNALRMLKNVLN